MASGPGIFHYASPQQFNRFCPAREVWGALGLLGLNLFPSLRLLYGASNLPWIWVLSHVLWIWGCALLIGYRLGSAVVAPTGPWFWRALRIWPQYVVLIVLGRTVLGDPLSLGGWWQGLQFGSISGLALLQIMALAHGLRVLLPKGDRAH